MKTYNTLEELQKDIVNNTLTIDDKIKINFNLNMLKLSINTWSINACNIHVHNIEANNITAGNISAVNIYAGNINANNIDANNIESRNIEAHNINASNISAVNINAKSISYFASCCATLDLICNEIKSQHSNGKHWSLDGKVIINGKELKQ